MDRALSSREGKEGTVENYQLEFKNNALLLKRSSSLRKTKQRFSAVRVWVSKSLRSFSSSRGKGSNGLEGESFHFNGVVINNSVYGASPGLFDEKMESFLGKEDNREMGNQKSGNEREIEGFGDGNAEESSSSSSSDFLASEVTGNDEQSSSSEEDSTSPPSMVWPVQKNEDVASSSASEEVKKPHSDKRKLEKQGSSLPGIR